MEDKEKKSPLTAQNKRKVNFENAKSKFRAATEEVNGQQVRVLKGYPILFDVYGHPNMGSKWVEKIDRNALATVDFSNLVILFNHDTSMVLGRYGKNLTAVIDDVGLFVTVTLGNTFLDDYVYDRVERELVDGMSFWFDNQSMVATDWANKIDVVTKINAVYEVSIVTFPAYEETVVITADGTDPKPTPPPEEEVPQDPTPEDVQEQVTANNEATKQALLSLIELM
ncbi:MULTISPECIES: HK97 family phage prohead protease [unclassified Clostridium]|uniref:HK97 family phage prohead protease n=1 Tax=unclassified Clostridium TaxID=2614128 RepID=UPI0002974CB0|nr:MULTISPECIES: HK97 family phage prohead protease [unclassified Clostridium]EKQ50272.1 MAG: phage prohead protease, HK97 family [Clostridium sp. Maddingley MBC34-26]